MVMGGGGGGNCNSTPGMGEGGREGVFHMLRYINIISQETPF